MIRHPGLRRWVFIAVAVVLTVLGLNGAGKGKGQTRVGEGNELSHSHSANDMVMAIADESPPVVTRKAMDKLRLLEIHWIMQDEAIADGIPTDDDDDNNDLDPPPEPTVQPILEAAQLTTPKPHPPHALPDGHADAPPLVAGIPEGGVRRPHLAGKLKRIPSAQLNLQLSPYPSAGFLLPSYIGDQPHLAQEHLHQLGLLAIALNRTLVLPAVSKTRMGSCQAFGFKMYWTKDSVEEQLGATTITFADFLDYAERREDIATGQLVSMLPPSEVYEYGAVEVASSSDPLNIPGRGTRNSCLREDKSRIDFTPFSPLAIYPPPTYARTYHFGESVINTLSAVELGRKSSRLDNRDDWSPPTVLAINYEIRAPIITPDLAVSFAPWVQEMPRDFEPFEPAPLWNEIGEQIAEDSSPKIGVSWQTERVKPEDVEACAGALVAQVEAAAREHPTLGYVYLSTDLPVDSGDAVSPNMAKTMSIEHKRAADLLKSQLARRVPSLELLTFARLERRGDVDMPDWIIGQIKKAGKKLFREGRTKPKGLHYGLGDLDLTLVGMVDDRVLVGAEVLLVPGPKIDGEGETRNVCGTGMVSSGRIVDERWVAWAEQQEVDGEDQRGGEAEEDEERDGERDRGTSGAAGDAEKDPIGKIWEVSRTWS